MRYILADYTTNGHGRAPDRQRRTFSPPARVGPRAGSTCRRQQQQSIDVKSPVPTVDPDVPVKIVTTVERESGPRRAGGVPVLTGDGKSAARRVSGTRKVP